MKVLISGGTGFIGSALTASFRRDGHTIVMLSRRAGVSRDMIAWDPNAGRLDAESLEGFDLVVHLAGENLGDHRWTARQKERIFTSRVTGTRLLCETLAKLRRPPRALISASAMGYYGERGDEVLTESSPPGSGFLADVCVAWEKATEPAAQSGVSVVTPRFGLILAAHGGALKPMLSLFKLGLGGPFGAGKQWWSWVTLDDVVGAVRFIADTATLSGPVNVVAPAPVTNREFAKTLGAVLHRPVLFPVPAFALKLAVGEMAGPLLLQSERVQPAGLFQAGYPFRHRELYPALEAVLQKV